MKVLVVGAGASGMLAAWRAALGGHAVLVLEAGPRAGAKIRISGGGKCNLTHEATLPRLLAAYPAPQARFLKAAFHAFGPEELRGVLRREGVDTAAREDGRVFPVDGTGASVAECLLDLAGRAGATFHCHARVAGLEASAGRLQSLCLEGGARLEADVFILATGGASYPQTGTRGELLKALEALGLPVRPWRPALAPIPLQHPRPLFEGVALRGGALELRAGRQGRRLGRAAGDLVFTRDGVSGPAALELSESVERARREGEVWLGYELDPGPEAVLDQGLQEAQRTHPRMAVRTWLRAYLPERMAGPLLEELGLEVELRLRELRREARRALVAAVKAFPLGGVRPLCLAKGEVAAGGLGLEAVDPRTMVVKAWPNLRVCGELLDLNGPVGGYNLQAAFSTGFLAGETLEVPSP